MKRIGALLLPFVLVSSVATSGCLIGRRHGHVALFPPPALVVAAAVAAAATQPGSVWVEGHWDWVGDRWVWTDGEWIAERPGFFWTQGVWIQGGGQYSWRPGYWAPGGQRVEIRDHR